MKAKRRMFEVLELKKPSSGGLWADGNAEIRHGFDVSEIHHVGFHLHLIPNLITRTSLKNVRYTLLVHTFSIFHFLCLLARPGSPPRAELFSEHALKDGYLDAEGSFLPREGISVVGQPAAGMNALGGDPLSEESPVGQRDNCTHSNLQYFEKGLTKTTAGLMCSDRFFFFLTRFETQPLKYPVARNNRGRPPSWLRPSVASFQDSGRM